MCPTRTFFNLDNFLFTELLGLSLERRPNVSYNLLSGVFPSLFLNCRRTGRAVKVDIRGVGLMSTSVSRILHNAPKFRVAYVAR